jgi:hypothetical protein
MLSLLPLLLLQERLEDPLNLQRYNYLPSNEPPQQQQQQAPADDDNFASMAARTWGVHTMRWTGKKTPGWLMFDKKVRMHRAACSMHRWSNGPAATAASCHLRLDNLWL